MKSSSVDHYWKFVGDHIIRGDGPTTVHSMLVYLLSSPLHISNCEHKISSTFHVSISPPDVEQNNESTGTLPSSSQAQNQFTDDYLKSIAQKDNGSYVVKFPWKE